MARFLPFRHPQARRADPNDLDATDRLAWQSFATLPPEVLRRTGTDRQIIKIVSPRLHDFMPF